MSSPLAPIIIALLRDNVALQREFEDAQIDRDAYRTLAHEALHALADLTGKHRRQSERLYRLLDERRADQRRAA